MAVFPERSAQPAFLQSPQYKQQYNVCDLLNLTKKTLGPRHWRSSGLFIANFEQISHVILRLPLLTLDK